MLPRVLARYLTRIFLGRATAVLLGLATLLMTPMAVTAFLEGPLDPEVPWLYRLACSFVAGMLVALGTLGLRRTPRVEQLAFAASVTCIVGRTLP